MEKFTQGPWEARSRSMSDGSLVVMDGNFEEIACIRSKADRAYGAQNDQDIANADLIAAAPDLYAALELMINYAAREIGLEPAECVGGAFKPAREALAKARGEK